MLKQSTIRTSLLFCCLALGATQAGTAFRPLNAQPHADGAKVRLEITDRLRMFSQRIAAATCNYVSIADDPRREVLEEIHHEFARDLIILRDGDPTVGVLTGNHDRRVNLAMGKVGEVWAVLDDALVGLLETGSAEHADVIYENNMVLLEAVNILLSEEERAYANPYELTFADAMLLDLAGRQRMLTQMMAKEVCLISIGQDAMEHRAALQASEELFSKSLSALRDGMPEMGIKPQENPIVIEALTRAWDDWLIAKEVIDRAALDHVPTAAEVISVRDAMDNLLEDSNMIEEILAGERSSL